ncbi:MAG: hypothetical protein ACRCTY_08860 [Candidatus Adiutrix sp.]
MVGILANITQTFNQSPQVSSLVVGHQTAVEDALLRAQLQQSLNHEQSFKKVLSLEDSAKTGKLNPDEKQSPNQRRNKKRNQLLAEKDKKEQLRRTQRKQAGCKAAPDGRASVIDVCI